ncbi:MAG: 2Fe-2S iron-sulfur cluster-binding protein [Rhodoferax sp.]
MTVTFLWAGDTVTFRRGETYAAALRRAGIDDLGPATGQLRARYFCGIGACQACLVSVDGASPVEACLTPAKAGAHLSPAMPSPQESRHV